MAATNSSGDAVTRPAQETAEIGRGGDRRRDSAGRDALVARVLSEFREMPCMRLTSEQAQRLFGLQPDVSRRVIDTLIDRGHLRRDADGRLVASK